MKKFCHLPAPVLIVSFPLHYYSSKCVRLLNMFLLLYRNMLRHLERIFIRSISDVLHVMRHLEKIVIMRRMEKHIAGM